MTIIIFAIIRMLNFNLTAIVEFIYIILELNHNPEGSLPCCNKGTQQNFLQED